MNSDSQLPSDSGDTRDYDGASRIPKAYPGFSAARVTYSYEPGGRMMTRETADGGVEVIDRDHSTEESPVAYSFRHDEQKRLFVLTGEDGKIQHFRDNPTRYLRVEPDAKTGEMKPVTEHGKPVSIYLCREEREI